MLAIMRFRLGVVAAALFAGAVFGSMASAQQAPRMLCESLYGQPAFCAKPGLTEAFVVQVLDGQCNINQQWSWNPRGIAVNNGCRAVFGYRTAGNGGGGGYYSPPPPGNGNQGQPIQCSSMNFQPARCAMDTRGGVTIGMITNQPCRQGQTWGWDRGGVWVTGNCRAWFRSANGGGGNGGIGTGAGYPGNPGIGNGAGLAGGIVECSSWQYQPARCNANTRNGVELIAVIGGECVRNRSWGWDQSAIWVNEGCRARFRTN